MADRKRLALIAAIMGSFVVGLDATAVNVALPAIRSDLGGGLAGQQWVSNAYLLALGSLILVGGSLGDVYGERRVFSIGVAGFGVMSLLCAIAPSIGVLIACRALQGVFGALLTPSALAVIVAAFPREERGGAIGSWTAWSGIATVIGPLAGGYLVDAVSWRLIFAVNVPFVLATLALVSIAVPAREPGTAHARVDWLGAGLTFFGLAGPVLALIRQPVVGWSSPEVWAVGLGGLLLLALFVVHERRTPAPMLPLELFKRRNFAIGNVQTFAMYGGLSITFFLLVLYLQEVAGYTALKAGLALTPSTLVMFALSKRVGRLADRLGPRLFMSLGPLTAAVGVALMLRLGAHVNYLTDLLPALLVFSMASPAPSRPSQPQCSQTPTNPTPASPRASTTRLPGSRVCLPSRRSEPSSQPSLPQPSTSASPTSRSRPRRAPQSHKLASRPLRGSLRRLPDCGSRAMSNTHPYTHSTSAWASRPRSWRSEAWSASLASVTLDASCYARTAPAASSPASHWTPRYTRILGHSLRATRPCRSRAETHLAIVGVCRDLAASARGE
jgi:EmrB/QacA subfamily drug resistance transporter